LPESVFQIAMADAQILEKLTQKGFNAEVLLSEQAKLDTVTASQIALEQAIAREATVQRRVDLAKKTVEAADAALARATERAGANKNLARFGYDAAVLASEQEQRDALENATQQKLQAMAERYEADATFAQAKATAEQSTVVFLAIAKTALRGNPEAKRKLGIAEKPMPKKPKAKTTSASDQQTER
jgi:ketosteroid isomerase-like protein